MLRNEGGNSFVPVATAGDSTQSLGAARGDGDEDLFIANFGSSDKLFRNDHVRWEVAPISASMFRRR